MLLGTPRTQDQFTLAKRAGRKTAAPKRRADVLPDTSGPYDLTDSPGKHRAHRRDCTNIWVSTGARCTGGEKTDPWATGCTNAVCPRHYPEAYADCMARHTPETIVTRHGMTLTLAQVESADALGYFTGGTVPYKGTTVDVNL